MAELDANAQLIRVCALALALVSCGDSEQDCSRVRHFTYDASYTELTGNCGPYVGPVVHVNHTLATDIRIVGNTRFTAEHVVTECTFRFGQLADVNGAVVEHVFGELPIEADGSIRGAVTLRRFDGSGEPTCSGDYDLVLTPRMM